MRVFLCTDTFNLLNWIVLNYALSINIQVANGKLIVDGKPVQFFADKVHPDSLNLNLMFNV